MHPCPLALHFLVSIHAPTRGATSAGLSNGPASCGFNPRGREGRDAPIFRRRPRTLSRFNPRAREGRDAAHAMGVVAAYLVSIHAPARGATRHVRRDHIAIGKFQSTRPRGARPPVGARSDAVSVVSIHAPARGATSTVRQKVPPIAVSIHAPARGATSVTPSGAAQPHRFQSTRPRGARLRGSRAYLVPVAFQSTRPRGARLIAEYWYKEPVKFQSTRPRGARPGMTDEVGLFDAVSIHAPARGATSWPRPSCGGGRCFNPRAREGRDLRGYARPAMIWTFQSTRPRGARLGRAEALLDRVAVSIHAPARGATSISARDQQPRAVSIHAPARGATDVISARTMSLKVSIHAPARGATTRPLRGSRACLVSIHAPARGATLPRPNRGRDHHRFNPRAREGRDGPDWRARQGQGGFNPRAREGRDDSAGCPTAASNTFQSTRPRGARHTEGQTP